MEEDRRRNTIGRKVICHKCIYKWRTLSRMKIVTCPYCGAKTTIEKKKEEIKRILQEKRG